MVTCHSGESQASTWWQETLSEVLLEVVKSGVYDDTFLLCSDGKLTAPRAVVALAFPSLYSVLRGWYTEKNVQLFR